MALLAEAYAQTFVAEEKRDPAAEIAHALDNEGFRMMDALEDLIVGIGPARARRARRRARPRACPLPASPSASA